MKILDALRRRRAPRDAPGENASSPRAAALPLLGYDNLDHRAVGTRLDLLTHAELDAVETYERSHAGRQQVLDQLRAMRMREPLPSYDGAQARGSS